VTRTVRLPLLRPTAIAAGREGIWIADAGSTSAVLFDPASADVRARVPLEHKPIDIAVADDIVAVALDSGEVAAFGTGDRRIRWHRPGTSQDVSLGASRDRVWAWDRGASRFVAWDRSGVALDFAAVGATAFTPSDRGVYSIGARDLRFQSLTGESLSQQLPDGTAPTGALLACANSVWIGVPNGLLLTAQDTLAARVTLRVPAAHVTHLVCFHGRIFGGDSKAVFSLEPSADDNARALDVRPTEDLLGLAVSGRHLWVLQSGTPDVHVVRVP
jgi:hypothetical protein